MSLAQHRKDVAKAAPAFAEALRGSLAAQKKSALENRAAVKATDPAATLALKEALQPAVTQAVGLGANRVASVAGADAGDPNEGLAASLAYGFAVKFTNSNSDRVDALDDDADDDDVSGIFDSRSDAADDIAATIISGAVNAGAQVWADDNADQLSGATKTWEVGDDDPCPDCDIDGESVSADDDFSNGSQHGPMHSNCDCTVDWEAPDNTSNDESDGDERSVQRTSMTDHRTRPATADERRDASMSFGDQQSAVYTALFESMQNYANPYPDLWIDQIGNDWVIYECAGEGGWQAFRQGYAIDADGNVTFDGDATSVEVVTSYVPTGDDQRSLTARQVVDAFAPVAAQLRATSPDPDCERCGGAGTVDLGQGEIPCPMCGVDDNPDESTTSTPRRGRRRQRRDLPRHAERRLFSANIELRGAAVTDDEVVLRGMPIRFDASYEVRDMVGIFRETMRAGVADNVMESRDFDCRFLENHEGRPMARTLNGTLTLTSTPEGIVSEARVDTRRSDSRDLALAIERGDITQMSCGFMVADDDWAIGNDGVEERDVLSFGELFDVSAVTYPASPTTSIELAQRMMWGISSESRERIRRAWEIAKEIREGKVLSQQNGQELMAALEALHEADDVDIPDIVKSLQVIDHALDAGQAGISSVTARANPDGDPDDLEPALVPPPGEDTERAIQRQKLVLLRTRDLLAV